MDGINLGWPGWKTVKEIGSGSYGTVYRIERELFGIKEEAALKVIFIPQSEDQIDMLRDEGYDEDSIAETMRGYVNNVVREYSTMKSLSGNTNIVDCDEVIVDADEEEYSYKIYMKMELLTPLAKSIDKKASFTPEQALKVGMDICSALIACKKLNIIHRDIKPENIFISKLGDYKLGDFGIAKTVEKTIGGTKIGTYKFMAPEVYKSEPYGLRADLYSLGLVMYWMLNEKRMPFVPLPPKTISANMSEESRDRRFAGEQINPPANGSESLKKIVLRACAYKAEDRYSSPEEMLKDLLRVQKNQVLVDEEKSSECNFSDAKKVLPAEFKSNEFIKNIVIPEGVVEVGKEAFSSCTNLETVILPDSLKKIGSSSFEGCSNLLNVAIPSAVTSIGAKAFADCNKLKVLMPKNDCKVGKDAFLNCASLTEYIDYSVAQKEKDELTKKLKAAEKEKETITKKLSDAESSSQGSNAELEKLKKDNADLNKKVKTLTAANESFAKAAKERKVKEEAEAKAKAEAERKAKEEAERKAKKAAEADFFEKDRLAKAEAERKAKAEATSKTKESTVKKAENRAKSYEENIKESARRIAEANSKAKTLETLPENLKVGDYLKFGHYKQTGDNDPIIWRILGKNEDSILVISNQILDCVRFNDKNANVTWETCSLRKWLNDEFINKAFDSKEKELIQSTCVNADMSTLFETKPGNVTNDKVFLLSSSEANLYFSSDDYRRATATSYADKNGSFNIYGFAEWLLRTACTACTDNNNVASVSSSGFVDDMFGVSIDNEYEGVRPAMWVKLKSNSVAEPSKSTTVTKTTTSKRNVITKLDSGTILGDKFLISGYSRREDLFDIYSAKDIVSGEKVEVRALGSEFSSDEKLAKRFENNAKEMAKVSDRNIAKVFGSGSHNNTKYVVQENIEGMTLKSFIEKKGKLSIKESLSIAVQICNGISAAQESGVVHGNLSSMNVYITTDGIVKVANFGDLKVSETITQSSRVNKSVFYISPEQARGGFIDKKSDIYSMGIVLYEMLAGTVPFDGESAVSVALKHIQTAAPLVSSIVSDVPESIDMVIAKCLEKKPDKRYDSIDQLNKALKDVLINLNNKPAATAKYSVGTFVKFGSYEQGKGVEPISWQIIDKTDDAIFVISKDVLDAKPFQEVSRRLGKTEANWQSCSLRKWLNNEFLNSAFSLNEQKMINTVAVKSHKNKVYDTDCGSTTSDKVFLLSATEMEKYYKSNALRKSQPTEFAKKQKVLTGGIIKKTAYYWLRTSGKDLSYATVVDSEGLISEYGNLVLSSKYGVRPAMWIRC